MTNIYIYIPITHSKQTQLDEYTESAAGSVKKLLDTGAQPCAETFVPSGHFSLFSLLARFSPITSQREASACKDRASIQSLPGRPSVGGFGLPGQSSVDKACRLVLLSGLQSGNFSFPAGSAGPGYYFDSCWLTPSTRMPSSLPKSRALSKKREGRREGRLLGWGNFFFPRVAVAHPCKQYTRPAGGGKDSRSETKKLKGKDKEADPGRRVAIKKKYIFLNPTQTEESGKPRGGSFLRTRRSAVPARKPAPPTQAASPTPPRGGSKLLHMLRGPLASAKARTEAPAYLLVDDGASHFPDVGQAELS